MIGPLDVRGPRRADLMVGSVAIGLVVLSCVLTLAISSWWGATPGPQGNYEAEVGDNQPGVSLGWSEVDEDLKATAPPGRVVGAGGSSAAPEPLKGLVVMNFWASWCGPCRREMPILDSVDQRPGVTVVGVSVDRTAEAAASALREFDVSFPSFLDPYSQYIREFSTIVPVRGIPSSLVLLDGKVVAAHVGEIDDTEELVSALAKYGHLRPAAHSSLGPSRSGMSSRLATLNRPPAG